MREDEIARGMRSARANEVSDEHRKRLGWCEAYSSERVLWDLHDRTRTREMEALDALAVAERHIRARSAALHSTRSDRDRSDDSVHCVRREPVSPFQSARKGSVESAIEHAMLRRPVRPTFPWRPDERSESGLGRACSPGGLKGRGPLATKWSRLRGHYSRECGAVGLFEREYPAQRPRAARRHAPLLRARSAATRERAEGFQRTTTTAVDPTAGELTEKFVPQLPGTPNSHRPHRHATVPQPESGTDAGPDGARTANSSVT